MRKIWYNITNETDLSRKQVDFLRDVKDNRTEGKDLQFSLFSFLSMGAGLTNAGFLVAIAVLACILGAEIAGICILISKMLRARKARFQRDREEEDHENRSSYHYDRAVGTAVLLGAIPQASYTALTVLAILTALAAVVFVVLLIIFRACGYDFTVTAKANEKKKEKTDTPADLPEEEPVYAVLPDDDEAQAQEAYTSPEADEPLSAFDESDNADGSVAEAPSEEQTAVAPIEEGSTVTTTTVREEPVFSDGTKPYKVVEKVVTETVKEVYRETPAPTAETQQKSGTDAVMEKLADFLEYELQKRKENDQAEAATDTNKDSVPTFATSDILDEDIDDEDDDEDETEDAEDAKRDEDDDIDDEENDTEGDHFTGNERIIGFDEETGCYIVAHYRKSFEAKLIQSRSNVKQYYSELKNALLSYGGTKSRISWAADSFSNERTPIAKINVKTRTLELYLALDPASLEDDSVYKGQDVSNKKKYVDTPFRYKIRSPRKLKWALELVQRTCEEHGLSPIDIEPINYEELYPFDTTENLVERKLIKEYIRQEKPATSFELAPDHVPEVPTEDDSVIPANANFSWEFDNEVMEEQAEMAEPEPTVEEELAAEPELAPAVEEAPAPAAEPTPSVFKETVKVTEMRYTERYYANGEPTYEQVITTEEPVQALSEPVTADFEDHTEAEDSVAAFEPITENVEEPTEDTETADTAEPSDPFAVYDDLSSEAPEENEQPLSENKGLPFRPSFYANRNYYEDEKQDQTSDESLIEEVEEEAAPEYVIESEPIEEEPEQPAPVKTPANPAVAVVDLSAIEEHFPMGAVIDLEALKAKELVLPTATTLKIYTSAPISKTFTVEANHFTLDAIQAITDADGDSVMVR